MPKNMKQKQKLLYVMKLFQQETDDQHGITIAEIAKKLRQEGIDAERKSIYDDVESLRSYGLDIQMRRGKRFSYHLLSRSFEIAELKLLVDAVQAAKFLTPRKSRALIAKIEGLTSRYEAEKLREQVDVTQRNKTVNETIYYTVDTIHTAISDNRQIRFQYMEWTADKKKRLKRDGAYYVVSPWALIWEDERYYLVAYESYSNQVKHFRADKMVGIEPLSIQREGAETIAAFRPAAYESSMFGMYGGQEQKITLWCSENLAGVVIDRFGEQVILVPDCGGLRFSVAVAVSPRFFSWVFGFGEQMKILLPQAVQQEFCRQLARAQANYHEKRK